MTVNHTPGPWIMDGRLVLDSNSDAVAMVNIARPVASAYADAVLIAAAPEMLDALRSCITDEGAHCLTHTETPGAMVRRLHAINDTVRAILAKLENEAEK